ncbi:MAG: NosD domain-containing protein, partial [Candidatus Thermoplasmatota archaeon]|nr:NosD domain-containing protein [Candidatus Thermoplasmatota archaeon]
MKTRNIVILGVLGLAVFIGIMAMNAEANGTVVVYSNDFETDDGGWTPTATWDPIGDWEWSDSYDVNLWAPDGDGYNSGVPPPSAHSGDGLWGTKVFTDYTNSGGESWLNKTFDFSGLTTATLSFYSWPDAFQSFDYCYINVNGNQEYYTEDYGPTDWQYVEVDLSAYDGMPSVEISFGLHATTVVSYAGWYIDDVTLTSNCSNFVYIDENGNGQFDAGEWHSNSIQAAVDNASSGDIIYVWNGSYYENNITIDKPLTLIGNTTVNALSGMGDPSTTYLYYQDRGFIIESDYVNISGFYLINEGMIAPCGGISINHSNYCNISGNVIMGDYDGIYLNHSHYNTIYNNYISNNYIGIWMVNGSGHNTILMNNVSWNGYGVVYEPSLYQYNYIPLCWNSITYNNISHNRQWGIMMGGTHNETVMYNDFYYNGQGGTVFTGVVLQADGPTMFTSGAIGFFDTFDSTIGYNNIYGYYGIDLRNCTNVTVGSNQLFAMQGSYEPPIKSYDIYAMVGDSWELIETVHTGAQYASVTVVLPPGTTEVRIEQHGGVAAHMDYVALFDGAMYYAPQTAAVDGVDALAKLIGWDKDVADVYEATIELSWTAPRDGAMLFMVANEEQQQETVRAYYTPWFMFPSFMEPYTLVDNGEVTVDDVLGNPDFSDFWRPLGTGHPWGDTHVWLRCDGEYLYAVMEITSDNTYDDTGWGALYLSVDGLVREFRVDVFDETYG